MHNAGKGDKRRPTDTKAFESNFESIFSDRKPVRGSFIWCDKQQKMVSKDEYYANKVEVNAPMVMNDIQPYRSMQNGEIINSRSQHRNHLKQHGLIEIGNEPIRERKEPKYDSDAVKREIARHLYK